MKKISNHKSQISNLQKGFTLIELLVVIAILGVLATALLVIINPVEQLARGRDAGRLSSTEQLGKAIQAYYVSQGASTYPTADAAWQTTLKNTNEINAVVTVPVTTATCGAVNNMQGNVCYTTNASDTLVWTIVESNAQKVRAGGACATTPGSNYAAFVWSTTLGKSGVYCLGATVTTVPPNSPTLN